ncbi:MAG: GNAT family N-acetyltransferase [Steroidobacteraceae bacterium]
MSSADAQPQPRVLACVDGYVLSDDPARLDFDAVHAYLRRSYWAKSIPLEIVRRALEASLCIGLYAPDGAQVGLCRLISDYTTFCYVSDVYVLESHRGRGLSKAMMRAALEHPRLQGLRRWSLVTHDAHGLYEQFGFRSVAHPQRHMERLDPDIYLRGTPAAEE